MIVKFVGFIVMFYFLNQGMIEGGIGCNYVINIMMYEVIGNLD